MPYLDPPSQAIVLAALLGFTAAPLGGPILTVKERKYCVLDASILADAIHVTSAARESVLTLNFPLTAPSCVAGKYGRKEGQQLESSACEACSPGRFSGTAGSQVCTTCPLGTFQQFFNQSSCVECSLGKYGTITGSSKPANETCLPCPAGTWNPTTGQSLAGCLACEQGRFGITKGASDPSSCKKCDTGFNTVAPGSSSAADCQQNIPVDCDDGKEPPAPPFATTQEECVPILCTGALVNASWGPSGGLSATFGCAGCAPGRYGSAAAANGTDACLPCPPDSICPGFLSRPLNSTFLLSSPSCPVGANLLAAPPTFYDEELALHFPIEADIVAPTLVTSFSLAAFTVFAVLPLLAFLCGRREQLWTFCKRLMKGVDSFSAKLPPEEKYDSSKMGSRRYMLESKPRKHTIFGGSFTLFAFGCLILAVVYYILSYYSLSNVTVTSTLGFLKDSTRLKFQQLPWLNTTGGAGADASSAAAALAAASTEAAGSASTPMLPPFNGLLVRVLAMGEPGLCDTPLSFASSGITSSSANSSASFSTTAGSVSGSRRQWTLQLSAPLTLQQQASLAGRSVSLAPSTTCRGTNFSAFTFACDSCELQDTSSLTFLMHYSCQALVVEVLSAGPGDPAMSGEEMLSFTSPVAALYRVSAALADSAGNSTHFLSGVSLSVRLMRGVVYDTRPTSTFTKRIPGLPLFFATAPLKPVTGRGYILYGGASGGVFVNATKFLDRNSSLYFTPSMRSVTVGVTFTSSEIYSITKLSLTTSLNALVTSIMSLGGVFSSFSVLYALLVIQLPLLYGMLVARLHEKAPESGGGTAGGSSQTLEGGAERPSTRVVEVEELERAPSSSSSYEEGAVRHSGEGSELAEPGTTAAVEAALQLPSEPAGAMAAAAAAAAALPPTPPTGPHRTSRFQPLPPPDAWGEASPPSQTLKQQWGQQQAQQYLQQQAAQQAEQHAQLLTQLQLQEAQAAQQALQAEMQAQAIASRVVRNPLLSVRDPLAAALPEPPSPPSAPSSAARKAASFYESSQRAVFLGGVTHSPGVGVGLPFTSIPGRTVFGATPSATSSPRAGGSSAVLSSAAPPTLPAASRSLDYYFGERESTQSKNLE